MASAGNQVSRFEGAEGKQSANECDFKMYKTLFRIHKKRMPECALLMHSLCKSDMIILIKKIPKNNDKEATYGHRCSGSG